MHIYQKNWWKILKKTLASPFRKDNEKEKETQIKLEWQLQSFLCYTQTQNGACFSSKPRIKIHLLDNFEQRSLSRLTLDIFLGTLSQCLALDIYIRYLQNANNEYWTFLLWVKAHCVNGEKGLHFVKSSAIKNASISTTWCWYCASSMQLY